MVSGNFIERVLYGLARGLRLNISEENMKAILQFVKFGIVGFSNTIISYVIYVVSLLSFEKLQIFPDMDYLISQVIAFFLSVLWSFYWNNKYVFVKEEGKKRSLFASLIKTYISYAFTGLFLSTVLSYLWVSVVGFSKLLAPILNLIISVPLNFILNKMWAFRNDK